MLLDVGNVMWTLYTHTTLRSRTMYTDTMTSHDQRQKRGCSSYARGCEALIANQSRPQLTTWCLLRLESCRITSQGSTYVKQSGRTWLDILQDGCSCQACPHPFFSSPCIDSTSRPTRTPPAAAMTPGTSTKHYFLALLFWITVAAAQTSTTLVSVTRTTTIHVTATDYEGACQGFVGACVVYGSGNAADYTTTVYQYGPSGNPGPPPPPPPPPPSTPTPVVTSTTTFVATMTASNSDACRNFNGACVVYGPGYGGASSSTVYYAGSSNGNNGNTGQAGVGNSGGYIAAQGDDGGDGQLGGTAGAMALKRCTYEALIGLGLAVGVAALLI